MLLLYSFYISAHIVRTYAILFRVVVLHNNASYRDLLAFLGSSSASASGSPSRPLLRLPSLCMNQDLINAASREKA